MRSRIYRYYGALIAIERGALSHSTEEERKTLVAELDHIEESLNTLRMPLAYADAFYVLREHIGFVRARDAGGARDEPDRLAARRRDARLKPGSAVTTEPRAASSSARDKKSFSVADSFDRL